MKLRKVQKIVLYLFYTILAIGVTVAVGDFIVQYPEGTDLFRVDSSGDVKVAGEVNVTTGLIVMSLPSCDTIDTDANGSFKCGTDGTGAGILNNTNAQLVDLNVTGTLNVTGAVTITATDNNIPLGGGNITDGTITTEHILDGTIAAADIGSAAITSAGTELDSTVGGDGVIVNSGALDFDCSDVTDSSATDHIGCSTEDLVVADDFVLNTGDEMIGGLNITGNVGIDGDFNTTDSTGGYIKQSSGSFTVVLG